MRVTFLTHYFPPEVGAPQARIAALAAGLADRGHDVTVHTGFPHYPDGGVLTPYRNAPLRRERRDGVSVLRTLVYPAPNSGFARRLADHAVFAAGAVAAAPLAPAADVLVVESPPLLTAGAAVPYARLKRARLVLVVSDRWPASAVELGAVRDPRAIALAERLERRCYLRARRIVVPTEGLERDLGAVPEAAGRVVRIGPSVDVARFVPTPPPAATRLEVLYAGTVGLAQNLRTLCDAAGRLGPDRVRVTIAGSGAEADALRALVAQRGLRNVRLLGPMEHERVPELYAQCHVAVVLLRDRPIFEGALPTKLLEAMASGRPVVVSARGEAARFVADAGAGIAVAPEDPAALAQALGRLAEDRQAQERFGAAGRRTAERFARSAAVERWDSLLSEAAAA